MSDHTATISWSRGRLAMAGITLRPRVRFAGAAPDIEQIRAMHNEAHERCFLTASVSTPITVETVL